MNSTIASAAGPLAGIRVFDLTIAMAGPLCTQRMGEMGADVIKIEAPGGGDFSRRSTMAGITRFGDAIPFVTLNRNKRSLVLDLKSDSGRQVLQRMARDADVVVQNFRPGVATRLGVDYGTLREINPRLVYASINGYGETGPMRDRPGQDLLLQSFTGLTMNGGTAGGPPQPSPLYLVDAAASHLACQGILAGLVARGRTGQGQEVKVSMLAAIMEMQIQELTAHLATDAPARRSATPAASIWMEPPYGHYACANGYLALAQGDIGVIGELLGVDGLGRLKAARPPQADTTALAAWRDAVYNVIAERLRTESVEHWDTILSAHDIWCAAVNDYARFVAHPQTTPFLTTVAHPVGGDYRTPKPAILFPEQPDPPLTPAPAYGQDTRQVLGEAGFTSSEIESLLQSGAAIAA